MGIAHAITRFFACKLSLADILFLSGHAQNMIKQPTKAKEKNFCRIAVEKLKSDSDNEDEVKNARRSFEQVFIYNSSILEEN